MIFLNMGLYVVINTKGIKLAPLVEHALCPCGVKNWGRPFFKAFEGGFEGIIHIKNTQMQNILMGPKNSRGGCAQQQ
jgi:hypothetical protein